MEYDQDFLFRVVSYNTPCKPRADWSFRACNPEDPVTAERVTAHVAGDNKDTALISTTDNLLWAIFFAFRATRTSHYDQYRDDNTVYIYFISNDIQDRTPEIQLNLELPSIRSKYLNIWELNQDYVKHKVYRKGKWDHRLDYSKENGEILVRKEIPSTRVLGRCRYIDLEDCQMSWWLDKVTGNSTQGNESLPKYQEAMRLLKLETGETLLEKIAASAQKMHFFCLGRDGIASIVTSEALFYIMIYGLTRKESEAQTNSIRMSAKVIWDRISSETEGMSVDDEIVINPTQEMNGMEEKDDALIELED